MGVSGRRVWREATKVWISDGEEYDKYVERKDSR